MDLSEMRDMMRTLANVDSNRLPDTEATFFLNDAKDEIMHTERLRLGEELVQSAFLDGTQTINPTASGGGIIAQITDMWYAGTDGERAPVHQRTWAEYIDHWGTAASVDDGSGSPTEFAIWGEDENGNPTIYLGPIPDADTTPVYISARITFPDFADDDDENNLSRRLGRALVYKALVLASDLLEDPDRKPHWESEYQRVIGYHRLSNEAARRSAKHARSMQEPG